MELKTEDYENIWLRLKDKFAMWVLGWSVIVAAITGFTLYQNVDKLIKTNTSKYLESDAGRKLISKQLVVDLPKIEEKIHEINEEMKNINEIVSKANNRLKDMGKVPFKIEAGSLAFITKDGGTTRIDYGQSIDTKVIFKNPFKSTPYVVATEVSRTGDRFELAIRDVTKDGFSLSHANDMLTYKYNWIAIGQ